MCTYSEEGGVVETSRRAPNDHPICCHVIRLLHAGDEVLLAQKSGSVVVVCKAHRESRVEHGRLYNDRREIILIQFSQ